MVKKLHELIEMAHNGLKFEAEHPYKTLLFFEAEFFRQERGWTRKEITADWTVRMKREPKVYYIRKGEYRGEYYEPKPFYSSVLTEAEVQEIEVHVPDIRKRLTKFIEVIENEQW